MTPAWEVLGEAGVPDGAIRPAPARLGRAEVRQAILDLASDPRGVAPRQVEPLRAWRRGWRRHWPGSFASVLGAEGEHLIAHLETRAPDPDRYLKLRRIAVENLSRVL